MRLAAFRLALAYAGVAAVAIGALAALAVHAGADRIRAPAERRLRADAGALAARIDVHDPPRELAEGWLVDTETYALTELGDDELEPPVYTLAFGAVERRSVVEEFSQRGRDYLVAAHRLPGSTRAVVLARPLHDVQEAIRSLRVRVLIAAAALLLAASAAGTWLAARSLRPARLALEHRHAFLADVAHELRTPIAVIQASASQALQRPRPAEDYVRALSGIRAAAERAATSVGELLDLARLEDGRSALRLAPLRLDLLLEEVAALPTGATDVVARPGEPIVVEADYPLLRQAVENVVNNAAGRAREVTLSSRVRGRDAVIEIADDGPGFPPDVLPDVFDRFRRGDGAGTGLGLAIVRSIVEAHAGRVAARNRAEGGAVVELSLPASPRLH